MLGEACALAAALTWSLSVVLFKQSEKISPQGLNLFKNVVAVGLLLATMPIVGVAFDLSRPRDDWYALLISGVLGIAIADTLVFMALRRLGAGLLAVVDCVYAPVIVTLSVLALAEPVTAALIVGGIAVVGGVLLATSDKLRDEDQRQDLAAGVAFGIAGIVAMAIGVVVAKPVLERGHLVEVTTVRLIAGVAGQLIWIAFVPSQRDAFKAFVPDRAWRTLVPASVLSSYVAMLLWLGGFKWALASVASVLNQLSSVFTIVLARLILGEKITPRRAVGAAFAVVGALYIVV